MRDFDVAVAGGGASGLMAALAAARGGARRVAVLEKNDRVGKKLLATGNGRCNLTNRNAGPEHYHGGACGGILKRFPPQKIIGVFESMGLWCRELDGGRVYPFSLQASSVLNFLRRNLEAAGVSVLCGFPVERARAEKDGFLLQSGKGSASARSVVFASGGKAGPRFGSDGNAFPVLRSLGHSVTELRPALVPVKTEPARVRPLKGVRCPARAALLQAGKTVAVTDGEVQFADGALSGICIFELARFVSAGAGGEISLNFLPEVPEAETMAKLALAGKTLSKLSAAQVLEGILPKALAAEAARAALGDPMKPAGSLKEADFRRLVRTLHGFRFPALGTRGWDAAQVTAGGVPLSEVDENLQSKFHKGLCLCGELLDVDGDCGGYNLQWAWASGLTAGKAAAAHC